MLVSGLLESISRLNTPFSVLLELTARCNLRCRHCYMSHLTMAESPASMPFEKASGLLSQLENEGCMNIILSGGEPLLWPDIYRLVSRARSRGFHLILFTNGAFGQDTAAKLADSGLSSVSVSLHSSDPAVHDRRTGIDGSFDKTILFSQNCRASGMRVEIKCVAGQDNIHTIDSLKTLCAENAFNFSLDPLMTMRHDGGEIGSGLILDEDTFEKLVVYSNHFTPRTPNEDQNALICEAGRTCAAIAPDGALYPCVAFRQDCGNVFDADFSTVWRKSPVLEKIRGIKPSDMLSCKECPDRRYCSRCMGHAHMAGDMLGPAPYGCKMAGARRKKYEKTLCPSGDNITGSI